MMDQWVWVIAAYAVGAMAAGILMLWDRAPDGKSGKAAAYHFFLGVGSTVLGTGHLVVVIVTCLSSPLLTQTETILLILQGLLVTLPGLLIALSVPALAAGQCDGCRAVAASDLWLVGFLALTNPALAPLPLAGLLGLLSLPMPWAPAMISRAMRRIAQRVGG